MLPQYKTRTNIGVGIGVVLSIASAILMQPGAHFVMNQLGILCLVVGTILFVWGCWSYAQGKGYHGAWGLLGLLSCVGLVILVLFPDRHKEPKTSSRNIADNP
ncbi:MAG: hypothetical protein ACOYXY_14980 [Thermodesulfobacteriota bacterium]